MAYIEFKDVIKAYGEGEARIHALDGASFTVERGELAIILGASGAGKTTALNILGGMDTVTSGTVTVDGRDVSSANEAQLVEYRRADVGFVFQFYNLVPNLTALENVELAAQICPDSLDAEQTLRQVGLGERLGNFPAQLSGGEQQRVSIARALAKNPKLLLCDEPTGALDYKTGKQILQLLQDTCRKQGITVIIITHNSALLQERPRGERDGPAKSRAYRDDRVVAPMDQDCQNSQNHDTEHAGRDREFATYRTAQSSNDMVPTVFRRGIYRMIRGSLKRFLSIVVITALGVSVMCGLKAGCEDLCDSVDAYFDQQNVYDINVQSK